MIFDDETVDYKVELKKANNELSDLKQKYQELEADRDYIKSLLNISHEHNCKLKKENEQLKEEISNQKFTKKMMRDNIKDYEKSIKHLRKSFEKFDEMRLRRIRFLEKRLKKNGLSIYVNDSYDVE